MSPRALRAEASTDRRAQLVASLQSIFEPTPTTTVLFVTVVRAEWLTPPGALKADQVRLIRRWTQKRLRKLPRSVLAAGAVEFSFNVVDNDPGRWSPHVHLVLRLPKSTFHGPETRLENLKGAVRNLFRGENARAQGLYRTVVVKVVGTGEDLQRVLTYLTKAADPNSTHVRSTFEVDGGRVTFPQSLKAAQRREFNDRLGALGLDGRLILVGLRRSTGASALRPTRPARVPRKGLKRGLSTLDPHEVARWIDSQAYPGSNTAKRNR